VYRLPGMSLRAGAAVMEMMEDAFPDWDVAMGRPKLLTLSEAVRMALMRLRRNVGVRGVG
jgi:hypothetical protein